MYNIILISNNLDHYCRLLHFILFIYLFNILLTFLFFYMFKFNDQSYNYKYNISFCILNCLIHHVHIAFYIDNLIKHISTTSTSPVKDTF